MRIVERLRASMKRAETLPWCWEQCGEKEDAPVVGVAFDANEAPISGELRLGPEDDDVLRWNIASEWGSGIDATSPSANAAFVVEAVNAMPQLLDTIDRLDERLLEAEMRAHKWMEAHDKLKAGKPYNFPEPADLPRLLALLEQAEAALEAGRALVAKLDQVSEDSVGVFQIAAAHGYEYRGAQYGEALETFRVLLAKIRAAAPLVEKAKASPPAGSDVGEG